MKKIYFSLFCFLLLSMNVFAAPDSALERTVISNGIGLGSVVAAITSWERNRSVLLMIIHGIFSWLYVIYFLLTRKKSERR